MAYSLERRRHSVECQSQIYPVLWIICSRQIARRKSQRWARPVPAGGASYRTMTRKLKPKWPKVIRSEFWVRVPGQSPKLLPLEREKYNHIVPILQIWIHNICLHAQMSIELSHCVPRSSILTWVGILGSIVNRASRIIWLWSWSAQLTHDNQSVYRCPWPPEWSIFDSEVLLFLWEQLVHCPSVNSNLNEQ